MRDENGEIQREDVEGITQMKDSLETVRVEMVKLQEIRKQLI